MGFQGKQKGAINTLGVSGVKDALESVRTLVDGSLEIGLLVSRRWDGQHNGGQAWRVE